MVGDASFCTKPYIHSGMLQQLQQFDKSKALCSGEACCATANATRNFLAVKVVVKVCCWYRVDCALKWKGLDLRRGHISV